MKQFKTLRMNLQRSFLKFFDQAGNFEDGNLSPTSLDIDIEANDPTIVSMVSSNAFPHLAKTGDELTITFGMMRC